jgi:lipopolysaccharide biosynthesis glycosyltransferase
MKAEFFIGWDPRESLGWQICVRSLLKHAKVPPAIHPISITHLGSAYRRPTERRDGRLWDTKSNAYMSTEFSLARFWTPSLSKAEWSIFCDGDFLFRSDVAELEKLLDPQYAVMVVKHDFKPKAESKMDGQVQTTYDRKLWSSLIAFNNTRAACKRLDAYELENKTGLYLHALRWCKDYEIGELPAAWNFVPGHNEGDAKAVHFTQGTPDMGYDNEFAPEWWSYA